MWRCAYLCVEVGVEVSVEGVYVMCVYLRGGGCRGECVMCVYLCVEVVVEVCDVCISVCGGGCRSVCVMCA